MLFNSYFFIFVFFPVTFAVYSFLNKIKLTVASRVWLVAASLFFYAWWNAAFLPLILVSVAFNYAIGFSISRSGKGAAVTRRSLLIAGLLFNLLLLGYFKYYNFFVSNLDHLGFALRTISVILPLGISFFTFTQIAYLVDTYRGTVKEYSLLNFMLFVTFFPHLIAGPIIHHKEMMPQFESRRAKVFHGANVRRGLLLFSIGLFKKLVLADTFGIWANYGFDRVVHLSMIEAWLVSLSYTFQLYFDFSGYTDMALGGALFFNITLPANFNSPYQSLDMQEFWRRWHMTLSRFFMEYVYIPLGGNRGSAAKTCANVLTTFVIGGLWHGAGWLFIVWGFLHGIANVVCRIWKKTRITMNRYAAWPVTFLFINFTWVFFRSKNWEIAQNVLAGMVNCSSDGGTARGYSPITVLTFVFVLAGFVITLGFKNSNAIAEGMDDRRARWTVAAGLLFGIALLFITRRSEFLYFQF